MNERAGRSGFFVRGLRPALVLLLLLAPAGATAEELRVRARESVSIDVPGATAAYAVDGSVAEVTLAGATVRIQGKRTGMTTLTVVAGDSLRTFDVLVTPAAATLGPSTLARATTSSGMAGISYSSDSGRLTSNVTHSAGTGGSLTRVALTSVTHVSDTSSYARTSLPAASIDVVRGDTQLTLLDRRIAATDLQRVGRSVRGVHYRSERLALHAGLLSTALYRNLLFSPSTSGRVASASYRLARGPFAITPHVVWSASESHRQGPSGLAPSVRIETATRDGRVRAHHELGYGDGVAASARLAYAANDTRASLFGTHLPSGFPRAAGGPPPGSLFRADVSRRVSSRVSFTARAEGGRRVLATVSQRTGSSSADLRVRISRQWSASTGARVSVFDDDVTQVTSVSVPVGVAWRGARTSASGVLRYYENTRRNSGGFGWRGSVATRISALTFRGSADYQREVATVELVFRESPELAGLFAELGIAVRTPEDLAQFFRNPEYPSLGDYVERTTATLSPWRLQVRGEMAWAPRDRRDAVRVSILNDRTASTRAIQERWLGTASYTRPLTRQLDLTGGATWWLTGDTTNRRQRWSYTFGVRARFNGMDGLRSMFRRLHITGQVFRDDSSLGMATGAAPLPGVRVVLDGVHETVTGADGRFEFRDVRPGPHSVEAMLPDTPGLRFTTPARVQVSDNQPVAFGIGRMPARVVGYVRDDAGGALRGVKLSLDCKGEVRSATSDSEGRYSIDGQEGECTIDPDPASLPSGYASAEAGTRQVTLHPVAAARADYVFRAMRSISGTLPPGASRRVVLRHGAREIVREADANGRFVFRNLDPGPHVLSITVADQTIERPIDVPMKPRVIQMDLRSRR